ncbi:MAG: hypothetical protein ACKKL5_00170 [Candidatus Komeilibacteria bacterium]
MTEQISGHKLIFEGAELTGKSFIISQVYDYLEKKYNSHPHILNGCHWLNCDIGIFGTISGRQAIEHYVDLLADLPAENMILEKLYWSDKVYQKLYNNKEVNYDKIEERLLSLGARVILTTVQPSEELWAKRLADRLSLYPHYKRIKQTPKQYTRQQEIYQDIARHSKLPSLTIDLTTLPDPEAVDTILHWLGEK